MIRRTKHIFVFLLACLSVLPSALRAQGYKIADGGSYHASSVYYVTLKNAAGEDINSQYAAVDGAIGAFVGDELRGASEWQPIGKTEGQGVFLIRVWGDKNDEATATFRLRDKIGLEYQIGSQAFSQDQEGTYGSPSKPVAFTVSSVTGISLPFAEITLKVGETYSVQPEFLPANHSALLTTMKYEYSSDNAAFTVSEGGMLSAVAVGQGTLTVKVTPGNFTAKATVKVEKAPDKVPVTEIRNNMASDKIEMEEGDQLLLDFSVLPENATNKAVKFTNDYDIVDIKQETETSPVTIVAKKAGEDVLTVISVDNEQATLTYTITVKKKVVPVTKIEVSPSSLNAYLGESYDFTLTVLPENATNNEVEATVENTSVISVDMENKKITAKAVGTSKIVFRAKDGSGVEATLNVTVSAVPVVTLSFADTELTASKLGDCTLSLKKEGNADFLPSRVELVFSKATNGEPAATATMADKTGLKWTVRGKYVGKHTVKIKYNGKEQSATCRVNVPAEFTFIPGWDWISFYAVPSSGPFALPSAISGMNIDDMNRIYEIRSQESILRYDEKHGYFGQLTTLGHSGGTYKVLSSWEDDQADKMVFNAGYELSFATLKQVLQPGYNWITYPYEHDHALSVLNAELSKVAEDGDMIIGRTAFAEFNADEWTSDGNFAFQAGKGYIYYNAGNSAKTLQWQSRELPPDDKVVAASPQKRAMMCRYPETMAMVASLSGETLSDNCTVRAYVDGDLRGEGSAVGSGLFHITATGVSGEKVAFSIVNGATSEETPLPLVLPFVQKAGSSREPVMLDVAFVDNGSQVSSSAYYDLQGRRLSAAPQKGLYIKTTTVGGLTVKKIIKK